MFYYLGRKKRLAKLYPTPQFPTIIEPFAGSAAYSLHGNNWERDVVINDLDPNTIAVWRYLQAASIKDIESLPEPMPGAKLSDYATLAPPERWLISYHINPGANQISNVVTKFNRWPAGKRYILNSLHKIKHWSVIEGDYRNIENRDATWFIDPPYHKSGKYYMTNTVDHKELADWSLRREGQVIVCEQDGAGWLPFKPLATIDICGKSKSKEVVYHRVT